MIQRWGLSAAMMGLAWLKNAIFILKKEEKEKGLLHGCCFVVTVGTKSYMYYM